MLLTDTTFIFQIHNRQETISELMAPFSECQCIVYNDGSTDNTGVLLGRMEGRCPNIIIKNTSNIYETEITHDAFQVAKTDYLCLIQDDDYYRDLSFANDAVFILRSFPEIAGLSPKHGIILNTKNFQAERTIGRFNSTDGKMVWPNYNEYGFQYVDIIDRAPMFIRRSSYEKIGGVDRGLLRGGYNDWDMCIRWKKIGQRVAVYKTHGYEFRYWEAGTRRPGSNIAVYHAENRRKVYAKHKTYLDTL